LAPAAKIDPEALLGRNEPALDRYHTTYRAPLH
jgi:hypothetical protein